MSQLTKNQLGTENSNSFPNNNTGYITPTLLRTFNQNMIDSLVDEDSYIIDSGSVNAQIDALQAFSTSLNATYVSETEFGAYTSSATATSASFNSRINALDPSGSAQAILALQQSTASLNAFTASQYVSNSLFIQSSQTSSMKVLSSSFAETASYALNTQNIDTGSLVTTSSFNSYTASASTNVSASINAATQSLSASLTLTDNSKLNTGSFNTYTASAASGVSASINAATSSLSASIAVTDLAQSSSIAALQQFSSSLDTTFATDAQLSASASTLQDDINTRLLTSSFQTYTQSNDNKVNSLISATGSYATTGSNTFNGSQSITGSVSLTGTITATSASFQYVETVFETASTIYSSGSNQFGDASDDVQTLYGSVRVINALTASKLEVNGVTDLNGVLDVSNDATFRGDVLIQSSGEQKLKMRSTSGGGVSQGFDLLIQTSSFIIRDETHNIDFFEFDYNSGSTDHTLKLEANRFELNSGSLGVSGSFTASLAEGYVWVGGVGNVSTAISTASLVVSVNTGSFATTGSNTFIGNQIISGNLLVSGANINLEVDPPALGGIGTTNVKTVLDTSASAIVTSLDLTRQAAGPTGDLTAIRLQTFSGSSDTSGDRLLSRITTGVNRNTSTGLAGSVVNTQVNAVWATGSSAFTAQIVETAQSGSATLFLNAGNIASNYAGGTASFNSGFIRIGSAQAHRIEVTGSTRFVGNTTITGSLNVSSSLVDDDGNFINGGVTIVGAVNGNAIAIKSGSFALTTPQGSGSFYSNCPITSSGLRINGVALVNDLIISGVFSGNSTLQVGANASVSGNLFVSGVADISSISASKGLSLTGSAPTIVSGNFSGSLVSTLTDTYASTPQATFIVTIDSASMATLLSGATTNANTLYFVI